MKMLIPVHLKKKTMNPELNLKSRRPAGPHKKLLHIDMTPMVDLGFLLITFFIFTSMMGSPTSMNLVMPTNNGDNTAIPASGAVTLLIDGSGFRYFEGQLSEDGRNVVKTELSSLRRLLREKKAEVMSRHIHDSRCAKYNNVGCEDRDLVVVIKPLEDATYENILAALDEMTISQVKRFVLADVSEDEKRINYPNTGIR